MEELISRLAAAAGIDPATAEKAVGLIFNFLDKEGPADAVSKVIDAIPGARDAANTAATQGGSGGLLGTLGSMLGGSGGDVTALGGQLMGAGLSFTQIQPLAKELFAYAGEKAGPEAVGQIVSHIPGLGQFV